MMMHIRVGHKKAAVSPPKDIALEMRPSLSTKYREVIAIMVGKMGPRKSPISRLAAKLVQMFPGKMTTRSPPRHPPRKQQYSRERSLATSRCNNWAERMLPDVEP